MSFLFSLFEFSQNFAHSVTVFAQFDEFLSDRHVQRFCLIFAVLLIVHAELISRNDDAFFQKIKCVKLLGELGKKNK